MDKLGLEFSSFFHILKSCYKATTRRHENHFSTSKKKAIETKGTIHTSNKMIS